MRIKICGITSAADATAAVRAGADAVGLNFVSGKRQIDTARAASILPVLPRSVTPVALVTVSGDELPDDAVRLLERFHVTDVQLYGNVTPQTVRHLRSQGWQPWVVRHARRGAFPHDTRDFLDACGEQPPHRLVLDTVDPGQPGGTGRTLDWSLVADARESGALQGWPPLFLAGGLTAGNVGQAISIVRPWGVDVSSGVESEPGRKSAEKMEAFVRAARG